jgi:putative Mn2+ efflux pump MntP
MSILELMTLIGILTLDCIFVSAFLALTVPHFKKNKLFLPLVALYFAALHTTLGLIGISIGKTLLPWIMHWDHWVVFILFTYFSWKQWTWTPEEDRPQGVVGLKTIIILGILCGMDVFSATLSLAEIISSTGVYLGILFFTTAIFTLLGPRLFKWLKSSGWKTTSRIASIILFSLGLKILLEHLAH